MVSFLALPLESPNLNPLEMDSLPSDRGRSFDSFDPMASRYFGEDAVVESLRIARIRSNFSEINEKFKSGFSIMSTIKAMLETHHPTARSRVA